MRYDENKAIKYFKLSGMEYADTNAVAQTCTCQIAHFW